MYDRGREGRLHVGMIAGCDLHGFKNGMPEA